MIRSLITTGFGRKPFVEIRDGSAVIERTLRDLVNSQDALIHKFDFLHYIGVSSYENTVLSPVVVLRMIQRGISRVGGVRRSVPVGFEHEQMCCTHPEFIEDEFGLLCSKILDTRVELENEVPDASSFREKLETFRFCNEESVLALSDRELAVYALASETQRIMAYIHPWVERVGRTSEEARSLICLMCGVDPLVFSTSENRSTLTGYERGIVIAITAIPVIREIALRLNLSTGEIKTVPDLYMLIAESLGVSKVKEGVYSTPYRHWHGHNVYPDENVMKLYYETLHQVMHGLIDSICIENLFSSLHTAYLTAHLIGRGFKALD